MTEDAEERPIVATRQGHEVTDGQSSRTAGGRGPATSAAHRLQEQARHLDLVDREGSPQRAPAPRTATRDRALAVVTDIHARLASRGEDVPLRLWDGRELGRPTADFRLVLNHPWSLRALLLPPTDLAAGEAYLAGDVDVEGSMVAAMRELSGLTDRLGRAGLAAFAARLLRLPRPPDDGRRAGRPALHGRRHSRSRDAAAVRHHYDQEVGFFRCFLDPALVYSCGYFAEADRTAPPTDRDALARAQRRKLELVCRKLALRPGERFLDVGCGWGALVEHAARHHGVEAVGVTLSPPQAAIARERIAAAGLADRVRIEVCDYRDVEGTFDAIASVGMVEHVGSDQLPTYAASLFDLLRERGRLLNHGITTGRRDVVREISRDRRSFVGRYVFPDGALVPLHHTVRVLQRAGFEIWDVEQLRPHYALTCEHWVANLEASAAEAQRLAGDRAFRIWRAYLAGSSLSFAKGDLGVVQVLATRGPGDLPFGRDRMLSLASSAGPPGTTP